MPLQTISILRKSTGAMKHDEPTRDEIDADVEGPFAIHEQLPTQLGGFALTHVPTGYQVLWTEHEVSCRAARAELLASALDWTFDDPKAVTSAHRVFGKALREKYEGK